MSFPGLYKSEQASKRGINHNHELVVLLHTNRIQWNIGSRVIGNHLLNGLDVRVAILQCVVKVTTSQSVRPLATRARRSVTYPRLMETKSPIRWHVWCSNERSVLLHNSIGSRTGEEVKVQHASNDLVRQHRWVQHKIHAITVEQQHSMRIAVGKNLLYSQ
jgi:hypothetical protein